jgi:hypothetical protein
MLIDDVLLRYFLFSILQEYSVMHFSFFKHLEFFQISGIHFHSRILNKAFGFFFELTIYHLHSRHRITDIRYSLSFVLCTLPLPFL